MRALEGLVVLSEDLEKYRGYKETLSFIGDIYKKFLFFFLDTYWLWSL